MPAKSNAEVAAQWVQGLTGDWSLLEALSSPTMRVWHSHDGQWLTREESEARMAAGMADSPPSFGDVRALSTETGFVVQATLAGLRGTGPTHIVQICTVEGGRIASCEEYIAPETIDHD
jgi:hypothetical protein